MVISTTSFPPGSYRPPAPIPPFGGAGDPSSWTGLTLATMRYSRGGQTSENPAEAVRARGRDGYRVGDVFQSVPSFDAGLQLARQRAADSIGVFKGAAHAQAVLQAADGAFFVTALGYGALNWHIDGPAYDSGALTVEVTRATPAVQAIVGRASWIDFRYGRS